METKPKCQEICKEVVAQVEFYFGDENYFTDDFMLNQCSSIIGEFMPTRLLLKFNKIKHILRNVDRVEEKFKMLQKILAFADTDTFELDFSKRWIRKKMPDQLDKKIFDCLYSKIPLN